VANFCEIGHSTASVWRRFEAKESEAMPTAPSSLTRAAPEGLGAKRLVKGLPAVRNAAGQTLAPRGVITVSDHSDFCAGVEALQVQSVKSYLDVLSDSIAGAFSTDGLSRSTKDKIEAVTQRAKNVTTQSDLQNFWGIDPAQSDKSQTLCSLPRSHRLEPLQALGQRVLDKSKIKPSDIFDMRKSYSAGIEQELIGIQREKVEKRITELSVILGVVNNLQTLLPREKAQIRSMTKRAEKVSTEAELKTFWGDHQTQVGDKSRTLRSLPPLHRMEPLRALGENLMAKTESTELYKLRAAYPAPAAEEIKNMRPLLDALHEKAATNAFANWASDRLMAFKSGGDLI
jgi:hypothetical protein